MGNILSGSIAASILMFAPAALPVDAGTLSQLYSFSSACCGYPEGHILLMNGSLFGTGTGDGNAGHDGQVFELTNSNGTWSASSPLLFDGTNGREPVGGLVQDSSGDLYGTTSYGGANGSGNAFYIFNSAGTWYFEKMWDFGSSSSDGQNPTSDLVLDSSGNVYGTTQAGGSDGKGIVFELSYSGGWIETILHTFKGKDGANPFAGLTMDSAGNLYGTTTAGGAHNYGTVFELTQSGGVWSEKVLHSFGGSSTDGRNPYGGLVRYTTGVLFGTTAYGGSNSCGSYACGTVFRLYLSNGRWVEKILHNFTGGSDGAWPEAKLTASGNNLLYGTASTGGTGGGGTLFKMTYARSKWSMITLAEMEVAGGLLPYGSVVVDSSGNIYGTTYEGGDGNCTYGCGTVWEFTP